MQFKGTVYRAHNPRWSWQPLSGEGAKRFGGRFNAIGQPALYTSLRAQTAMLEASPLGRAFQPLTLVAYMVDADPIFDATSPVALQNADLSPEDLASPNWEREMLSDKTPLQHQLAARLMKDGYVGMILPSFARGATPADVNAVFWRWNSAGGAAIAVIDDDNRLSH